MNNNCTCFYHHEYAILDYLEQEELNQCLRNAEGNLMDKLFSMKNLADCSMTGKNTAKPGLDQDKVKL